MNGLLLYREYLNNVSACVINYELPKIETKELRGILEVAKDIEDLAYLDKILSLAGSNGMFDKDKDFIKKVVRLESKLKNIMNVEYIENIISLDSLYDIEDSIIECVGDLTDISNEVNYKNFSISDLSIGDEDADLGVSKLKTYQAEISKMFGFLEDCKTKIKEEVVDNVSDPKVEINKVSKPVESVPKVEENKEIEGINKEEIDDIDEWVANQDKEIIAKYREREIEEDYFDEEYIDSENFDIFEDEESNESSKSVPTLDILKNVNDVHIEPEIEENKIEMVKEIEEVEEVEEVVKEEKIYKKKERLVVHDSVTGVDDALAKIILSLNDNITKLPKATVHLVDKVKGESKKIYSNMKVEDGEDEE